MPSGDKNGKMITIKIIVIFQHFISIIMNMNEEKNEDVMHHDVVLIGKIMDSKSGVVGSSPAIIGTSSYVYLYGLFLFLLNLLY